MVHKPHKTADQVWKFSYGGLSIYFLADVVGPYLIPECLTVTCYDWSVNGSLSVLMEDVSESPGSTCGTNNTASAMHTI